MDIVLFVPEYLRWHYSRAFKDLISNLLNLISFVGNFFSIKVLVRTFFAPWHRLHEEYGKGFNPESFFSALIVNTLMRLVGVVFRFFVIVAGIVSVVISVILSAVVFLIWIFFPVVIAFLIALGIVSIAS